MKAEVKKIIGHMEQHDRRVSSRFVADMFGKVHAKVVTDIEKLGCSEEFSLANFRKSDFVNDRGRSFTEYMMTRDGFSFLCMGFTGKKAAVWKEGFIAAFNAMEERLRRQLDADGWKQARLQLKDSRKDLTDVVKDFVDYAISQGSKNAPMYFANITKMEYAALELIEKGGKIPDGFRDTLDRMQIAFLTAAEQVARRHLVEGMRQKMHYKEIYVFAKQAVERYAAAIRLPGIEDKSDKKKP